jgi:tetratricopeptide (TPR) repeat protein
MAVVRARLRPLTGTMDHSTLPPRLKQFIGRNEEFTHVYEALRRPGSNGCTVLVVGERGIGKSALAAEVARRLCARFDDGCVWLDAALLTPRRAAVYELAATVLRALGVESIPLEPGKGTVELARSVLRDRQVLIVIDGVEEEHQVLDLLPQADWHSAMILTSRKHLRIDAQNVAIGPLSQPESVMLLRAAAHDPPILRDVQLCSEFVHAASGQPLAITLIGRLLYRSPGSAREVLHDLRNEVTRSSFAERESVPAMLRGMLAATYERLSPPAATLLRRIALLETNRFTIAELSQVTKADGTALSKALDELKNFGLVNEDDERYSIHMAVRRFAREQLVDEDIHFGSAAASMVPSHLNPPDIGAMRPVGRFHDEEVQRERSDRIEVLEYALRVATEAGDSGAQATALVNLGTLHGEAGRLEDASAALLSGLAVAQEARDVSMVAHVTLLLGQVAYDQAMLNDAEQHFKRSAQSFEEIGDTRGRTRALMSLGDVDAARGYYSRAVKRYKTALAGTSPDDAVSQAGGYGRLAYVADRIGEVDRARELYVFALRTAEEANDDAERAELLLRLALLEARTSNLGLSRDLLETALDAHLRESSLRGAARAALGLGCLAADAGEWEGARVRFGWAREVVEAVDVQLAGRAAYGCAVVAHAASDIVGALSTLEFALAHFREAHDRFGEAHALQMLVPLLRECGDDSEARAAQRTAEALFEQWGEQPLTVVGALHAMTLDDREWAPRPSLSATTDI